MRAVLVGMPERLSANTRSAHDAATRFLGAQLGQERLDERILAAHVRLVRRVVTIPASEFLLESFVSLREVRVAAQRVRNEREFLP